MGERWTLRTPLGEYRLAVARQPGLARPDWRDDLWFFARCFILAFEPEAVASALALHERLTGNRRSLTDTPVAGTPADVQLLEQVCRDLEWALGNGQLVFEPARPTTQVTRPREEAIPLGPEPEPTEPAELGKVQFELRIVDEIGEPITGVEVTFAHSGARESRTTDGSGSARYESEGVSFATVAVRDPTSIARVVEPRWSTQRSGTQPTGVDITSSTLADSLPAISLEDARPHTLVIVPERGRLSVEVLDRTGCVRHVGVPYEITGPMSYAGETNEAGLVEHEDVPFGEYELAVTLDDGVYRAPLVVLESTDGTPQVAMLGFAPRVYFARLRGMLFETNKCFLLPSAIDALRRIHEISRANSPGELLIVGHTDTSGDDSINDPLSLKRARAVKEYLCNDVEPWLKYFETSTPQGERWGKREELLMIAALHGFTEKPVDQDPVEWYQESHNQDPGEGRSVLAVDGICGPKTRRELVTDYMSLDNSDLDDDPEVDLNLTIHGCGEHFPLDDTGDTLDEAPADDAPDQMDRRVELFYFDRVNGIQPPPPGPNSKAGDPQYVEWRRRAQQFEDFPVGPVPDPATTSQINYHLRTNSGCVPLADLPYVLHVNGRTLAGTTDSEGLVFQAGIPPGDYELEIDGVKTIVGTLPRGVTPSLHTVFGYYVAPTG